MQSIQALPIALPRASDVSLLENHIVRFSENDIAKVKKARKTNVHSKQAIEKLSSLLVGEIVPQSDRSAKGTDSSSSNVVSLSSETHARSFDKYEFRRYAITEKVGPLWLYPPPY